MKRKTDKEIEELKKQGWEECYINGQEFLIDLRDIPKDQRFVYINRKQIYFTRKSEKHNHQN